MIHTEDQVKGVHHHKALIIQNVKVTYLRKRRSKTINSKMTTNSQLSTTEPKKQKLSKQLEQEQNYRNGDHMEGYHWGGEGENRQKRYRE